MNSLITYHRCVRKKRLKWAKLLNWTGSWLADWRARSKLHLLEWGTRLLILKRWLELRSYSKVWILLHRDVKVGISNWRIYLSLEVDRLTDWESKSLIELLLSRNH